jgi:hypothetical protein
MTGAGHHSLSRWKFRHSVIVWIGIVLNLMLAVPLLVNPFWLFRLLAVPTDLAPIWPRFAGGLLIILSVFYIPMSIDLDRYRIFAWLSILPSRSFGAVFFLAAVTLYAQPAAFFLGVLLDGGIGIASLWALINIVRIEQRLAGGGGSR